MSIHSFSLNYQNDRWRPRMPAVFSFRKSCLAMVWLGAVLFGPAVLADVVISDDSNPSPSGDSSGPKEGSSCPQGPHVASKNNGGKWYFAYYNGSNQALELKVYVDNECLNYYNAIVVFPTTVDNQGDVGQYPSLQFKHQPDGNNYPLFSYYDATNHDLKVAVCSDPYCSPDFSININPVDTQGDVGQYSSLKLNSYGDPVIAYYDATNSALKIVVCGNATCSSGNVINTVDNEATEGNISLSLASNNNPTISYKGQGNIKKKAVCSDPYCTPSETPSSPVISTATLTVTIAAGEGQVTSNTGDIDCTQGSDKCSITYDITKGAVEFILSPVPAKGYSFSHWGGDGDCTDGKVMPLFGTLSCEAYFSKYPDLTVSVSGNGSITGKGINCGKDCTEFYEFNTPITLTATPSHGNVITEWSGDCAGKNPEFNLVMNADKACVASFAKLSLPPPPEVKIDISTFTLEVDSIATFSVQVPESGYQVQWDFGDGATATTPAALHTYTAEGKYSVKVTVADSYGQTASKTIEVEVMPLETFPQKHDVRSELGKAAEPSATQLQGEQILREKAESPELTVEEIRQLRDLADEAVNHHLDLSRLGHKARQALVDIIYSKDPGATALLSEESGSRHGLRSASSETSALLKSLDNLAVSYDASTSNLGSLYNTEGLLSEASSDTPEAIAQRYLEMLNSVGIAEIDIDNTNLTDAVYSAATGGNHLYWQQMHEGLPLYNSQLQVNINQDGQIVSVNNSFISGLPGIQISENQSAGEAVKVAMEHLGVTMQSTPRELSGPEGVEKYTLVDGTGIALEDIPASLRWLPMDSGETRLVWGLLIKTLDRKHVYDMNVDATTGEVLTRFDQTRDDTYKVYQRPVESPQHTTPLPPNDARVMLAAPASTNASPFGWHDTDGVIGAEFTKTQGNNVNAYKSGVTTDCGADLNCVFPLNLANAPSTYTNASVANLFYLNNLVHDVMYEYGFDSPGGNFQKSTYGKLGKGNDPVNAVAQTSSWCNATFSTPSDGYAPTMSMYICGSRDGALDSGVVIHEYGHGISNRLVGGPSIVSCLSNSQQPGEGISDWLALVFTHEVGDKGTDKRGVGSYLFSLPPDGTIRSQNYSTSSAINTYTYESINGARIPHGVGAVWAQGAWEVYWALVDKYGFDPNLYNAKGGSGNQRMLLYVTEGLKNTKCNPAFTDVRDGIIQAAQNNYGGKDVCLIWEAFAKFGLGSDAISGGSSSTSPTNGFKIPDTCVTPPDICTSPTVSSVASGKWSAASIWNTGQVPGPNDRVLIKATHSISASGTVSVNTLCIEKGATLQASSASELVVQAALSSSGRAGEIYNQGKILGKSGSTANGKLVKDGTNGSSIKLQTDDFTNAETGQILAGKGGDDKAPDLNAVPYTDPVDPAKGGVGGNILIIANDDFINQGKIGPGSMHLATKENYSTCQGINSKYDYYVFDNSSDTATGGNGGQAQKWNGKFGDTMVKAAGETFGGNGGSTVIQGLRITNLGRISAGYGGNVYGGDCTSNSQAGLGGNAEITPLPGGTVTGLKEIDGGNGSVWIEPSILLGGQDVHIYNSKNVTIFGGNNTTLILRNLREEAIAAKDTLTLAVGQEGVIDLRGNVVQVLKAGVRTQIFADTILLDEGVSLAEVIDSPSIETYPSKILYRASLHAPGQVNGRLGETVTFDLTLSNSGPEVDTYTLTVTDAEGWPISPASSPVTIEGLKRTELHLNVTLPTSAARDLITVTATSQQDPSVVASAEIAVVAEETALSAAGQLLDEAGNPMVDAVVQIGDKTTLTDETGAWEITGLPAGHYTATVTNQAGELFTQEVEINEETTVSLQPKPETLPIPEEVPTPPIVEETMVPLPTLVSHEEEVVLPLIGGTCPPTGFINFLCDNHGRTITDATLGSSAIIAGGELAGVIESQGFVSQVIIQPDAVFTGGTLSGYVLNYGTVADSKFVGVLLQGGIIAGTLRNQSRVGGTLVDVTFAPHARLIGGRLQGNIQGDNGDPALLEKVRVLKGSYLSGVTLGKGVVLEEGVIKE